MSDEKEYFDPNELMEFVEKDTERILKKFNSEEYFKESDEFVLCTLGICSLTKYSEFQKAYNCELNRIRYAIKLRKNEGEKIVCKKVELIKPEPDCGINGDCFHLKFTFENI